MTARLPTPGQDDGTWGTILNDFLSVEHNPDGTLKAGGSLSAKADDTIVVHTTGSELLAGTKTFSSSPVVPDPTLGSQATNKTYVDTTITSAVADVATTAATNAANASNLTSGTVADARLPVTAQAATLNASYARSDAAPISVNEYATTGINGAIAAARAAGARSVRIRLARTY